MAHMPSFTAAAASTSNAYNQRTFRWVTNWNLSETLYATLTGNAMPVAEGWQVHLQGTARFQPSAGHGRVSLSNLHTGETADGRARVHTGAAGAFDSGAGIMQSTSLEAVLAFETPSTAAQEYCVRVGLVGNAWLLGGASPPLPGFGCFFRYNRAGNGGVHKWEAVCRDLDVETAVVLDGTTQSGISTVDIGTIAALSLPDTNFWRLKVVLEGTNGAATSAKFYSLGVLCATITTNLPTHSLQGDVDIQKTAGTTTRYLALDYTEYIKQLRTDRTP